MQCDDRLSEDGMNPNVRWILLYVLSLTATMSLYTGTQLSSYLYLVTNSNTKVGVACGVRGLCTMLVAWPVGYAADKFGRIPVIRAAGLLLLVSAGYMIFCVAWVRPEYSENIMFIALCISLGLWGCCDTSSSALDAIFADSVITGNASKLYSWRQSLMTGGNALGPLVAIFVFWKTGNHWEIDDLTVVMLCGLFLIPLPFTCLMLLRQSNALGEASQALSPHQHEGRTTNSSLIPGLVTVSDLVTALASGMTIQFFPLFFWRQMHLSPIAVNAIFVAKPLGIALGALGVQKLSLRRGRVQATLCVKAVALSLLAGITALANCDHLSPLIVGMYLVRTWLMNSPRGLMKSVFLTVCYLIGL